MKKMLMLASVASMIDQFNMSNIDILRKQGYEVHVAANFEQGSTSSEQRVKAFEKELKELGIRYYHVDFSRKITDVFTNIKAYKQIKSLMLQNKYEFIHCHSPIGGVCGRLAARSTRTTVIYTAHGFHFFKKAPLKNWLMYYPIERFLARYTDILITINKEDYIRAKQSFRAKKVEYIPGVGIDSDKFSRAKSNELVQRKELGISENAFVVLSVGELNKNKNHETVIRSIAKLNNPNIYYIICGQGVLEGYLRALIKELNLEEQVSLLGFRRDIAEICKIADVFAFPSRREGLGIAALEAMASGVPIVTSNIHRIVEYSIDNVTGYTCEPTDVDGFAKAIKKLVSNDELRIEMGQRNIEIVKKFDKSVVDKIMYEIYKKM